ERVMDRNWTPQGAAAWFARAERVTADAHSLILLAKTGGLEPLARVVTLFSPPAVAAELFQPRLVGVEGTVIQQTMREGGLIALSGPPVDALSLEEALLICHQMAGTDAVLTEDGRLSRRLAAESVPHLNALLVPALLVGRLSMEWSDAERLFGRLHLAGQYTPWIVEEARRELNASLHAPPSR
ncbi:MAG: hypothetical protein V3V93_01745, partial [bacterium]